MFDSFKTMGAVANLMKNKDAIQQGMKDVQARLEQRRIIVEGAKDAATGAAGIAVVMSGKMQVLEVRVSEAIAATASRDAEGKAQVERLLAGAVNAALLRCKEVAAEEIGAEAQKLGLGEMPGLEKLLGG
ncbi:MAG: YbaB/EbfC family nucleoid-associated protein [Phycisphaerales bacterium]